MSRFPKKVGKYWYWAVNFWDPAHKTQRQTTDGRMTTQEIVERGLDDRVAKEPVTTSGCFAEPVQPSPEPIPSNEALTAEKPVEPPGDVSGLPSREEGLAAFSEGYKGLQGVLALLRLVDPGHRYIYGIKSAYLMNVYESVARASRGFLDEEDSNTIDWPYSDEMPKEAMLRREECG